MKDRNKSYLPKLFDLSKEEDFLSFEKFKSENSEINYIDTLGEQKHDLSIVKNPTRITHSSLENGNVEPTEEREGVWVYFPWCFSAVRILSREDYAELRLSRNRNLITTTEQEILKKATISVAGLNVGNPGAVCMALEGIGGRMKLADFDTLSVSNLNRFRSGLPYIGINKALLSVRQMYEINPYLEIELFDQGITKENIDQFLVSPRTDVLVEEMDNLRLKILIREKAKANKIPVIMVTGNGENVIIDVERYDQEPDLPIMSGFLKEEVISRVKAVMPNEGNYEDRIKLARDFMGEEYLDPRLIDSFGEVGKTLPAIPQLAESSFLRGAAITHFVKKILLGEKMDSGRYIVLLSGTKINND